MANKLIGYSVIGIILFSILVPISSIAEETQWWDSNWAFKEEIKIPIDTSDERAKYQPIDILFKFNNSCWAVDENKHSVRIIMGENGYFQELESQIYDLKHIDSEHIESCSIVFLIPKEATGDERYFVYYNDGEKACPEYTNRVDVEESEYRYEKIPGLVFESEFFAIREGEYIIYAINKKGYAFGEELTQQVVKLKKDLKEVKPDSGEIGTTFDFKYWYEYEGKWYVTSTSEKLIGYEIIVDGNLMVKVGIISESNDGFLRSKIIYKYYFTPSEDKKIYAHVNHDVIKYPLPPGKEIDVGICAMVSTEVKSNTIDELNFGDLPLYLHLNRENQGLIPFEIDQYPDIKWQKMIGKEDDYDLGDPAWASYDEGETGKADAVIFDSNSILKNGEDEKNGIELQLFEANSIQLPGINAQFSWLYFTRNSFEKEYPVDDELPEGYSVEYNAIFFNTQNGGYSAVEKESEIYKELVKFQPDSDENITENDDTTEKFNLTAYIHSASSFPLGPYISTGLGKNVSYLTAELYKENIQKSSKSVSRLDITDSIPANFIDMKLMEKIKVLIDIFDWENFSLFKKAKFSNLEKGRYLIKIFLENPLLGDERKFIGYKIVDLEGDTVTRVFCKNEGSAILTFLDQENSGIKEVAVYLMKDDFVIAEIESNSEGKAVVKAPCGLLEKYTIKIIYKGFLIDEKEIRLGKIRDVIPLIMRYDFDVHDFSITIKDSDGKAPSFDIKVNLTSDEMNIPTSITPDSLSDGTFSFLNLYPANYSLYINCNSIEIKKEIPIPEMESLSINLFGFTANIIDSWDLIPGRPLEVALVSKDFEKNGIISGERISNGEYHFSNIFPGNYTLRTYYKGQTVEKKIEIPKDEDTLLKFEYEFNVTATVFDSHGNQMKNTKFIFERENKEVQGFTDGEGKLEIELPAGIYVCKIYSDGELVGIRQVEVINEKRFEIATTSEPFESYVIIGLIIILIIGVAFFSFKNKDKELFLKILAISLVLIAFITPWWAVYGSNENPHIETSNKLYLFPTEMVELIRDGDLVAGRLMPLDENAKREVDLIVSTVVVEFSFLIFLFTAVLTIGFLFIILSIALKKNSRERLSLLFSFLAIIIFLGSILVFTIAMHELSSASVGSFIGSGELDVTIPGENFQLTVSSNWGPSYGFYLLLCSNIILISLFILDIRKKVFEKFKKIYHKIRKV